MKLAKDRSELEEHANAILGMDIRGFTVHELYIEKASEIDEEYYAAILLDRTAKKPMAMLSRKGGMDIEAVADEDPGAIAIVHIDPLLGFSDFHGRRLAFEAEIAEDVIRPVGAAARPPVRDVRGGGRAARRGQPAADHEGTRRGGARRQGHGRRQRFVSPPRHSRDAQPERRGPAGADGQGARAHLREARRQHRHPRQRRRARDVHARRGGPGRRQARQLPRRRRRLQGGGDRRRRGGDPVQRQGQRRAVQHLRRHHALRRGGQRPGHRLPAAQRRRCRSWSAWTAPTTRRAAGYSRMPIFRMCMSRRRCWARRPR